MSPCISSYTTLPRMRDSVRLVNWSWPYSNWNIKSENSLRAYRSVSSSFLNWRGTVGHREGQGRARAGKGPGLSSLWHQACTWLGFGLSKDEVKWLKLSETDLIRFVPGSGWQRRSRRVWTEAFWAPLCVKKNCRRNFGSWRRWRRVAHGCTKCVDCWRMLTSDSWWICFRFQRKCAPLAPNPGLGRRWRLLQKRNFGWNWRNSRRSWRRKRRSPRRKMSPSEHPSQILVVGDFFGQTADWLFMSSISGTHSLGDGWGKKLTAYFFHAAWALSISQLVALRKGTGSEPDAFVGRPDGRSQRSSAERIGVSSAAAGIWGPNQMLGGGEGKAW